MNHLLKLLKWDFILFNRNKLILLSVIVAIIYIGVFYLLKPLGNLTMLTVILIFNDPVVTGFLFAGVLLLFDKNQNTLEAISVLPLSFKKYILSKAILLSLLGTVTSIIMALVTRGTDFNFIHLLLASFLTAFIFSGFGFAMSSVSKTFNQLLLYSIPFLIVSAIPFLPLFGFGKLEYFFVIPSAGGIGLLEAAFDPKPLSKLFFVYVHLAAWTWISWKIAVKATMKTLYA